MDRYGRKTAHVITGIPYIIGWTAIGCAQSTSVIILGRFFTGLSTGANKAVMLVYIGELASPKFRTFGLVLPSILLNIGILLSHIYGYYLEWKISSYVCIVPAVLISITALFLKESPLWLISKGRIEEGVEIFRWFRGTNDASEAELKAVLERQSDKPKASVKETLRVIRSRSFIKPMLSLLVVMVNIQFAGVTVLGFYSQDIFRQTFSGDVDPFMMMILMDSIVGIVSVSFCFLDKYMSKKKIYLISNFGVSVCLAGVVASLIVGYDGFMWVPVTCFVFFFCFSAGIVTIGWTFVPELLPSCARGLGSGLNSAFASISIFTIVKVTPEFVEAYGPAALYSFYGISTLICGTVLCFILPETDGKTLQAIEDGYNEKKVESTPL